MPETAGLREARRRTRGSTRRLPTRAGARSLRAHDGDVASPARRGRWRASPSALVPHDGRTWLSAGGALTLHLARVAGRADPVEQAGTSAYPVTVHVITERCARPWADEASLLGRAGRFQVWVREVVLSIHGTPCVVAHSVTGLRDSHGTWRAMRTLRTRPLAVLLYRDPTVRRSLLTSRRVGFGGAPGGVSVGASRGRADPVVRLHDFARCVLSASTTQEVPTIPAMPADDARAVALEKGDARATLPGRAAGCLLARRSVFERHGAPLIITECFLPAFWSLLARRSLE